MSNTNIPTGSLAYVVTDTRPSVGEEYTVYIIEGSSDPSLNGDWVYVNGEWQMAFVSAMQYNVYSNQLVEQVAQMEQMIADLEQRVEELEHPVHLTSWEMTLTSPVDTILDLYDENGEEVELGAFQVSVCEAEPITFMSEVEVGTYFAKNAEWELNTPLVADGSDVIQLGDAEVVSITPKKGGSK